jgi:hypothetical protein
MRVPGPILFGVACLVGAAVLGVARPGSAAAVDAELPRGSWSAGALGAYAILDMSDLNAALQASSGSDFEELGHGWEGALDVRYAFRKEFFVGLEGGYVHGEAEDRALARDPVEVGGVPLQVIAGGTVGRSGDLAVRIVAGIGVLLGGGVATGGETLASGTGLLTSLGGEAELRLARGFAVTAQALARQAKVSEPGDLGYDLDFSGGSLRLGVRGYWGGTTP